MTAPLRRRHHPLDRSLDAVHAEPVRRPCDSCLAPYGTECEPGCPDGDVSTTPHDGREAGRGEAGG